MEADYKTREDRLPIKWYYKWSAFIVGMLLIATILILTLDLLLPTFIILNPYAPLIAGCVGFILGLTWGILRVRHIGKLEAQIIYSKSLLAKEFKNETL